jgi:hypothetical protein
MTLGYLNCIGSKAFFLLISMSVRLISSPPFHSSSPLMALHLIAYQSWQALFKMKGVLNPVLMRYFLCFYYLRHCPIESLNAWNMPFNILFSLNFIPSTYYAINQLLFFLIFVKKFLLFAFALFYIKTIQTSKVLAGFSIFFPGFYGRIFLKIVHFHSK